MIARGKEASLTPKTVTDLYPRGASSGGVVAHATANPALAAYVLARDSRRNHFGGRNFTKPPRRQILYWAMRAREFSRAAQ
jgi:hypothetical protein